MIVVAVVTPMLYYESCPGWQSFCDRCVIATGILGALRGVLFVVVLKLASAARVSIVLQTGILFSVLLGGWVFREKHLWKRLVGAMLLVGGVTIVIYV